MKTISNKKGNEGFTVSAWNFHYSVNGGAGIDLVRAGEIRDERASVQFAIRQVRVHSAGKKVMRLEALENGEYVQMRGQEFKPEMPIYADWAAAEEHVFAEFARVLPELVKNQQGMVDRHSNGTYPKTDHTSAAIAAHQEVIDRMNDGRIALEIVG